MELPILELSMTDEGCVTVAMDEVYVQLGVAKKVEKIIMARQDVFIEIAEEIRLALITSEVTSVRTPVKRRNQ